MIAQEFSPWTELPPPWTNSRAFLKFTTELKTLTHSFSKETRISSSCIFFTNAWKKKMKRFKYFTSWIFLLILVSAAAMSQFTEPWLTGCTPFDCEILFIYRSSTCSLLLMLFIAQTQTLSEIFHTLCNYKLCTILNTQLTTLFKHLYDICFAKSLDNFYCILMCPNPILISF